jgi:peptide/nickel transport system substrate-binding protein
MTNHHTPSGRPLLRRAAAFAVAAVALAAPAVAGTTLPAHAADAAPAVKVAIATDIDTFNPFLAILASSTGILRFQYENLVQYGVNNEPVPGLSDKWETSTDGKTWTYHIRDGMKWSDSQPLTADDVAWTFNAVKTNPALQKANGGLVENVQSVAAKDPSTLELTLTAPQASNPGFELPIVPKHVWEKEADPSKYANDTDTVGSGPFTIKSYQKGVSVQLVANPNFWRGPAKVSGLTYAYYKNTDAAVQALKNGEVDIVGSLTPAQFTSLKDQSGITTNQGAGRRYTALAINPGAIDAQGKPLGDGNAALQDPVLRQAIVKAVDKQTLLTRVLQGLGKPGLTEMPGVYPSYTGYAPGYTAPTFDIAGANQLLDQAGYAKGADGNRTDKSGKPLTLRLMGRNSDPTHAQMAEFVKGWMGQIGIPLTVSMVTPNQVNDDSTLGKYDLYFTGWGIGPDPDFQLSINQCSSRPNADGSGATSENNWCDPAFDALYKAQHTELDAAKRADLVKQAFTMIDKAAINSVVWYADTLEAWRSDKFTGFVKQPENTGVVMGQNGYWGLYGATPVSADTASAAGTSASSGMPGWVIGLGIVAVIVVIGAVVLLSMRRRATAADRE